MVKLSCHAGIAGPSKAIPLIDEVSALRQRIAELESNLDDASFVIQNTNAERISQEARAEVAEAEVAELRQRIDELEQERRWIPVGERLPEPEPGKVSIKVAILYTIDGHNDNDYFVGFEERFVDELSIPDGSINHETRFWYPLPPFPTPEVE